MQVKYSTKKIKVNASEHIFYAVTLQFSKKGVVSATEGKIGKANLERGLHIKKASFPSIVLRLGRSFVQLIQFPVKGLLH